MKLGEGVFVIMTNVMVELLVFLLLDIAFAASPDRAHLVDDLPIEFDREWNKVGVLLDDGLDPGGLGKVLVLFLKLDEDTRAPWRFSSFFDFVAAAAL